MMKAPQEKILRDGSQYSTPNRRGRRISRASTRSDYPLFWRFACARTAKDFYPAAIALASKLLLRGQDPEIISHDMELLALRSGFANSVPIVVNDLAMRSAA